MSSKNSILIKNVPEDVRAVILKEQSEKQIKCRCRFSKEKTFLMIVRNWGKIKDYRINGVPVSKIADEL